MTTSLCPTDRCSDESLTPFRARENAAAVLTPPAAPKVLRKLSEYQIKGAFFSPTELVIEAGLSEREWMELGNALAKVCQSANWWIGDFIQYGFRTYGKSATYDLAQQATGYTRTFLYTCASTAKRFGPEKRIPELSFYHHMRAVSFPDDVVDKLLPEAAQLGLTAHQMLTLGREEYGVGQKKMRFLRKKVVIHLWTETYTRLLERADGMKPSHFIAQILEEYLTGKPVERYPNGIKTRAWREAVRES
jgi:hypothetical protein